LNYLTCNGFGFLEDFASYNKLSLEEERISPQFIHFQEEIPAIVAKVPNPAANKNFDLFDLIASKN